MMEKFKLIGVRVFKNSELNNTRYFEIGKLKESIEYTTAKENCGFTFEFICCDQYGNYICNL